MVPVHERKTGLPFVKRVRAAHPEPRFLGNIFFGDGRKNRGARLGGKQVVTSRLEFLRLDVEADRHQLPAGIQQKTEIHGVGKFSRFGRKRAKVFGQADRVGTGLRQQRLQIFVLTTISARHRRDRSFQADRKSSMNSGSWRREGLSASSGPTLMSLRTAENSGSSHGAYERTRSWTADSRLRVSRWNHSISLARAAD